MTVRNLAASTVPAFCLLATFEAQAGDWEGARSAARGGTGLADGNDVGAAGQNVATFALTPRYDMTAGGVAGPDETWLGRIAAGDSRTSVITLTATYSYRTDDIAPPSSALPGWTVLGDAISNTTSHQGLSLGLAYPLLDHKLAFGVTGRYDWRASEQEGNRDGFNFGVSMAARPWAPVTLALGIHNALDLGYPDTARLVDFGVRWEPGEYIGVSGELTTEWMGNPFEKSLAEHVGVDFGVTDWLRLSAGWQHQDGAHKVGGGLALVSDKAELDYSLLGEVGSDPARLWHGVDVRVHF